ncbi:hypothetical protein F7734_32735 [Scytonema sp. UIC 10036]|nr:hypothetical protein [Scytonema sp. UIC 10036]
MIRNLVEVTKDTIKDAYQAGGELIPSVKHLFGAMIGAATSPVTVVLEESHYQIEVAIAEVFKAKFQVLFQKKTWR